MSWTETEWAPGQTWVASEDELLDEFASPFTSGESDFNRMEQDVPVLLNQLADSEGPFASAFTGFGESRSYNESIGELLEELRDPEFEEALAELVQEASAVHAERSTMFLGEASSAGMAAAANATREYLEPVTAEAERLLEHFAAIVGEQEAGALGEAEVQTLTEAFERVPLSAGASPAFEDFLKGLRRVAGRALSGAVRLAARGASALAKVLPLGAILRRLKALVRPLLRRVLSVAINRLPVALRPAAAKLRRRILRFEDESSVSEAESFFETFTPDHEHPASTGLEIVHEDFMLQLAELLTAEEGAELERLDAELEFEAEFEGEQFTEQAEAANELDAARIRLIRELGELEDGESAAPAFERFLPAVLPVLRIGVRVAGRDRVVRFLAGFLAKMLDKFVGRNLSRPLSQAIVDAGMRLLTLEAPSAEDERLAGPSALAAVAEETARAILTGEDESFEDPMRLEAESIAAFNEAVARNFPPALLRPGLQELETEAGAGPTWVLRPRVYWYKKYTRVFDVNVTPQIARAVTSFGGLTLAAELRSDGTTLPVRAKVHLYEALPGTYLSRIAALEKHVPGMDWRRLRPLTVQAATALMREPGLGKDVDARFTANRNMIASGQRFYFLEFPGSPGGGRGGGGRGTAATCTPASQAFAALDGRAGKNEVRIYIFVCEPEAQAIASRLRQGNTTAFVVALRTAWSAAIRSVSSSPGSRVRVLQETTPVLEQQVAAAAGAGAASALASKVGEIVVNKLADAALRLVTDYARAKSADFIRAADDPKAGVTVILTFPAPGLSNVLRGGLAATVASAGLLRGLLGFASGRILPAMHTVPGLVRP